MENWTFWLIMVIILAIFECTTVNLVSVWFIISGLVSLILSLTIKNFYIEFFVFVILGVLILIFTRPILKKYLVKNKETTNLDRVVGMIGIVTVDIKKNEVGEVKVDGKRWSAISSCDIEKGKYVTVKELKGVKLLVEERKSDN